MKQICLLLSLVLFAACSKDEEDPKHASGLLIVKNDDGTISKEPYDLHEDNLPLNANPDIVFYTDAPGSTLGDPSAASKLLHNIREHAAKGKKSVNFSWVIRSEGLKFEAFGLIPKNVPTLIIDNWEAIRAPKVVDVISLAKVFISFPTFHYLSKEDVDFLDSFDAEYVRCTEYDFKESQREGITRPDLRLFETGLRPDRLGIFLEQPNFLSLTDVNSISKDDAGLRSFLANTNINWSKENLFFGYFNKEVSQEQPGSWSNLVNYASLAGIVAMLDSAEKGQALEANIVVPATKEQFTEIETALKYLLYSSHSYASKLKPILNKLSIEYFQIPKDETATVKKSKGPVIRIINPFPLAKQSMLSMLQMSHVFAGLTGDQSLSEGIQYGKIPFYQIMHWKSDFHKYMTQYLQDHGEESTLADFVGQFTTRSSITSDFLLKQALQVHSHQENWAKDMQKISEHIYKTKNLKDSLAPAILSLLSE
ncbi:MAG: hypothetical protein HRU09_08055 [Oligoflexales bacterium]|nr:hypothetical protein [Oligoflexales bacterium]